MPTATKKSLNVVLVLVVIVGIPTWRGFLGLHQQTNECFLALFTLASIVVMYYFVCIVVGFL